MQDEIKIPRVWLENLVHMTNLLRKKKTQLEFEVQLNAILGYISSAETLLKIKSEDN